MTATTDVSTTSASSLAVGSLVRARGREWVVLPGTTDDFVLLQPLGGGRDDVVGLLPDEGVEPASFPPPSVDDLGDAASTALLRTALRVGLTSSAGPFRALAGISVTPRSYQYVPLMMALRQDVVRLLIADDVGVGKTIEAGLVAAELIAQGTVRRTAVLCSPALAEQWQRELREKLGIEAVLLLTSTVRRLERDLMMSESIFDRYPHVIVSSDFIKSDVRRDEFLRRCPELVIVDEAHGSVAGGGPGQRSRHQRYELLRDLAADPARHLVLATATPHSGDDTAFTNLVALLDPRLGAADLSTEAGRVLLARHMVQRRRADIRHYLDQDTPFPRDRETQDVAYALGSDYRDLFDDVLAYAREQVRSGIEGPRGRVRWWSALALLRALASSPAAAAATLSTRASSAAAGDAQEADALGRAGVLDGTDDDTGDALDTTPGAVIGDEEAHENADARRLRGFARRAKALHGPEKDRKLAALTAQVEALLADGYAPIVFCRFIDTAQYVADHLTDALRRKRGEPITVAAVTGLLPPSERERRVAGLAANPGRHVLVATDCLSEGVNLQDAFSAVVHYDLAWNPTRHEQREGRVDRFGQRRDMVRALTLYGEDNGIDGIVLDVLIRKHRAIARATGVAVPVPGDGQALVDALAEGLLLRGQDVRAPTLDLGLEEHASALEREWQSAAQREKVSRTRFAQAAVKPEEVAAEVAQVRAALGEHGDLSVFVSETLRSLGSTVTPTEDGFTATLGSLPAALREALPTSAVDPLPFSAEPPAPRGGSVLSRTDPAVRAVARYVLESALDDHVPSAQRPARRAGVLRTRAVATRTTVMLVRFRFHLTLPAGSGADDGTVQRVAEDARVLAFEGSPEHAAWLPDERAESLLAAEPAGNIPAPLARIAAKKVLDGLGALDAHLGAVADEHADRLLESHRRARAGARAARRGLTVRAQRPVDVLSVQVLLPMEAL